MGRRRRNRELDRPEAGIQLVVGIISLLVLGMVGTVGFGKTMRILQGPAFTLIVAVAGIAVLVALGLIGLRLWRQRKVEVPTQPSPAGEQTPSAAARTPCPAQPAVPAPAPWTAASIRTALDDIDWYQFEKFCAALLRADGFQVERKGGAQPDGGVDLIVEKAGNRALIQCKHWKTWTVQEKVIREMLGSMTHFQVSQGAIYTLKGWTEPAQRFAAEHAITLVNGDEFAQSAASQLTQSQLEELLCPREHHCPKCESPMIWRTGNFMPFWGCSRYPICRGKFNHSGAC